MPVPLEALARLLAATLALCLLAGCQAHARQVGPAHYRDPGAVQADPGDERPVVLLVTGSLIVADFFDLMAERLEARGYLPVIYQPLDLFTGPLQEGAVGIGEAVDAALAATGRDRLHIIAECNGGVATRFYLEQLGGHARVDRFVSFVSAHNGSSKYGSLYPALADIRPDSAHMATMADSRMPEEATTRAWAVFVCEDEVMIPHATSLYPGATGVEVCDARMAAEARAWQPFDVGHAVGQYLLRRNPLHFAGFWHEDWFELFVAILEQDDASVRAFDRMQVRFVD